jgi:hypothetical protein
VTNQFSDLECHTFLNHTSSYNPPLFFSTTRPPLNPLPSPSEPLILYTVNFLWTIQRPGELLKFCHCHSQSDLPPPHSPVSPNPYHHAITALSTPYGPNKMNSNASGVPQQHVRSCLACVLPPPPTTLQTDPTHHLPPAPPHPSLSPLPNNPKGRFPTRATCHNSTFACAWLVSYHLHLPPRKRSPLTIFHPHHHIPGSAHSPTTQKAGFQRERRATTAHSLAFGWCPTTTTNLPPK